MPILLVFNVNRLLSLFVAVLIFTMTDSIKMDVLSDPDGQLNTLRDALSKSRNKFGDWMKQLNNRLDEEETAHLEYIAQQQSKPK